MGGCRESIPCVVEFISQSCDSSDYGHATPLGNAEHHQTSHSMIAVASSWAATSSTEVEMPVTTLGKWRQERYVISSDSIPEADGSDSDRYESHPQKKVKQDMTMVMDAARTIKGSFPATKTQQSSNGDPEEAVRGARRPTGTTAQEVYQALAGVGVSQEPIGTPAREESLLIEECVLVGGVQDDIGSEVPQQANAESYTLGGGDLFGIPARLTERQRLMFQTTQAG